MNRGNIAWLIILLCCGLLAACAHAPQDAKPQPPISAQRPASPTASATSLPEPSPTAIPLPTVTPVAQQRMPDIADPLQPGDPRRLPATTPNTPLPVHQPGTTQQTLSPVTWVLDIAFVDAKYGWALGRSVFCEQQRECPVAMSATRDGGHNWHAIPAPATFQAGSIVPGGVSSLRFASRSHGWAFGKSLFATRDGGQNWIQQRHNGEIIALEPAGMSVWAIERICSNTEPGICELTLLAASLDEDTWQPLALQPPLEGAGAHLVRADTQHAWITHTGGLVATHDGGQTWHSLDVPCGTHYPAITELVAHDSRTLWLLCNGESADNLMSKLLYTSADGGEQWQLIAAALFAPHEGDLNNLPLTGYPNDLAVPSAAHAFIALARSTLIGTRDGGQTWHAAINDERYTANFAAGSGVWRVLFADAQHGWSVAEELIFRSTDGGESWSVVAQMPLGKDKPVSPVPPEQ